MRILLHRADGVTEPWVSDFAGLLPEAEVVVWQEGETIAPCDYAVLWMPPAGLLADLAHVKAIFLTGAGADAILKYGDELPPVPIIRLGDAGMAAQMAEYVAYAVLRYFRRFDDYEKQARRGVWAQLSQYSKGDFRIGVMGTGVLGMRVIEALKPFGFPLRGWSRSEKDIEGVECFSGTHALDEFLGGGSVGMRR